MSVPTVPGGDDAYAMALLEAARARPLTLAEARYLEAAIFDTRATGSLLRVTVEREQDAHGRVYNARPNHGHDIYGRPLPYIDPLHPPGGAPEQLPPNVPAFAEYAEIDEDDVPAALRDRACLVCTPYLWRLPDRASRLNIHVVGSLDRGRALGRAYGALRFYRVTQVWARNLCGPDGAPFAPMTRTPAAWVLAAVRKTLTTRGRRLSRRHPGRSYIGPAH